MKLLITGGNGTVGTALAESARKAGHTVLIWDRHAVPYSEHQRFFNYLKDLAPQAVVNLAIGSSESSTQNAMPASQVNSELPALLAAACDERGVRFVHTSSVMVFEDSSGGPFSQDTPPTAKTGYGWEKRIAEMKLLKMSRHATIVRLGWQMDAAPKGNTMTHHLNALMSKEGKISASCLWKPACSFLEDTAQVLLRLAAGRHDAFQRVVHCDGNQRWSFFDIASALAETFGFDWKVESDRAFEFDQRMLGDFESACDLSKRMPCLEAL